MNEKQFSIRLSNGKEQSFETASEMAAWIQEQQQALKPRKRKRQRDLSQKRKSTVRVYSGPSALARYANRNSDET